MICTLRNEEVAIFDEVFDDNSFKLFAQHFNGLHFYNRQNNIWHKVWRINDGQVLSAPEYYYSKMPSNSVIDYLHLNVLGVSKSYIQDICGEEGKDWDEIVYTPYIYAEGTKISWHDDNGYSAACIFYCHEQWSASWGGELMVAKTPPWNEIVHEIDDEISRKYIPKLMNKYGHGLYISPLPNRLVFTKGSVWHAINRVDKAAGDNMRCSVVAFFKKRDAPATGCAAGACHVQQPAQEPVKEVQVSAEPTSASKKKTKGKSKS